PPSAPPTAGLHFLIDSPWLVAGIWLYPDPTATAKPSRRRPVVGISRGRRRTMTCRLQTCRSWLLAGCVILAAGPAPRAAETESRDYAVLVDGQHAGKANMTIQRQDDGTTTVSCETDVRVTVALVKKYRYTYRGPEVWKDGRLQRLDSTCDDD